MRAVQLFLLVPEALASVFYTQALSLPDQPHLEKPILLLSEERNGLLEAGRVSLSASKAL